MPGRQLLRPRIGSIAEDEVAALLRRLAFLNRPLMPDDVGADFVCAVAEERIANENYSKPVPMLYAGGWFLLSVKSGKARVGLERSSGHFDWFLKLESPFLIAQVEPEDEIRVTIYHTLQHIAVINNLPEEVKSVEFRCETSELYKPRNYRIDRLDIVEVTGEKAVAWLGPPLLDITRPQLLDPQFVRMAVELLQLICTLHPAIHRHGRAGIESGVMWETNKKIEMAVKGYTMPALVKTTTNVINEIEQMFRVQRHSNELIDAIWEASQPLFNFYKAMNIAMEEGKETITAEEIFEFTDSEAQKTLPKNA